MEMMNSIMFMTNLGEMLILSDLIYTDQPKTLIKIIMVEILKKL